MKMNISQYLLPTNLPKKQVLLCFQKFVYFEPRATSIGVNYQITADTSRLHPSTFLVSRQRTALLVAQNRHFKVFATEATSSGPSVSALRCRSCGTGSCSLLLSQLSSLRTRDKSPLRPPQKHQQRALQSLLSRHQVTSRFPSTVSKCH